MVAGCLGKTPVVNVALKNDFDPSPSRLNASDGLFTDRVRVTWGPASGNSDFSGPDSGFSQKGPLLSWLSIEGPSQVNEGTEAQYTCTAHYDDRSAVDVTTSASWSDNSIFADISNRGLLTAHGVDSDQRLTISAAFGGQTVEYDVTVKNVVDPPLPLARLAANSLTWVPPTMQTGQHPNSVTFNWHNFGPNNLDNGPVKACFYLSRNAVYGDSDDRSLGACLQKTISVGNGADLSYSLSGTELSGLAIPADASGDFYVLLKVQHDAGSPYVDDDQNPGGAPEIAWAGPIRIGGGLVRLAANSLKWEPTTMQPGQHPSSVDFNFHNFGPNNLVNGPVKACFYLSSNTVFGDGDDRSLGSCVQKTVSVGNGADLSNPLSAAELNRLAIPAVASGDYYVLVKVQHDAGSPYVDDDQNPGGAADIAWAGPISVALAACPGRFQLIEGSFMWHEAKADAQARGGHLATFTSEAEWNQMVAAVGAASLVGKNYFLGATDEKTEKTWEWVTGEPFAYHRWKQGEPNDANGNEDYLQTTSDAGSPWNDVSGGTRSGYILEYERGPIGDFNGDGYTDILWRYHTPGVEAGKIEVWFMNQTSRTRSEEILPKVTDLNWGIVGAGDFNWDGQTDLLWRYEGSEAIRGLVVFWFMNGAQYRGGKLAVGPDLKPIIPGLNWRILATGDFDGDCQSDILWRYEGNGPQQGQVLAWLMDRHKLRAGCLMPAVTDLNWKVGGTGDFDRDGQTDIVWQYQASGGNSGIVVIWLMDGCRFRAGCFVQRVPDVNWKIVGTGDYDGDGGPDLLWRYDGPGAREGQIVIWLMEGCRLRAGSFLGAVPLDWKIVGPR
jgi:hypothetical protein